MASLPDQGERFAFFEWPDGAALFDRETGDTHTLDPVSAFLMRATAHQTKDPEELLAGYVDASGEPLTEATLQAGLQAYSQLQLKGLVPQGAV